MNSSGECLIVVFAAMCVLVPVLVFFVVIGLLTAGYY